MLKIKNGGVYSIEQNRTEQNRTEQIITPAESKNFYCIKALAILSAVSAHLNRILVTDSTVHAITVAWEIYARLGVPVFLILSGFFFGGFQPDMAGFWKKKARGIMIPWLICSICTYGLSVILSKKLSILGLLKWIIGYGTWYYFVTVLLIFYLIFGLIRKKEFLYVAMVLTIISVGIHDLFGENSFEYLNFLNWIGFFALGILIRQNRIDQTILKSRTIVLTSLFLCAFGICITIISGRYGYFHVTSLVYEIAAFPILLKLCSLITNSTLQNHLVFVGQQTLFIYLVHMQIVQSIGTRIPDGLLKWIILPLLGLETMTMIIHMIVFIATRIPVIKTIANSVGVKV